MRLCLFCKHWDFEYDGGYSEVTPGEGYVSLCKKGHWNMHGSTDQQEYRRCMVKADGCPDFDKVEDEE